MAEIRNVRVLPRANYTTVPNAAVRDLELTFRARGLLVWMLSHESGRTITAATIIDAGPDGRDNVQAALRELEEANYITRIKYRTTYGHWAHRLTVTDTPGSFTNEQETRDDRRQG